LATCTDPAYAPTCTESLEAKSKAPTWLLDLDYKPIDDILTYISYKRGYRAGGVFVNAPAAFNTFKPEHVDTYELGMKSSFHGPVKGTFDVDGFTNNFKDQQLQIGFNGTPGSGNSSTTAIANAGTSRIYGVEVGASLIPVKGLVFALDYTYLKTKITSITLPVPDPTQFTTTSSIEPGDPLVLSPTNKYALSAIYTLPLGSNIGKISGGPTFVHTNKQISNYDYLHSPTTVANLGGNWGLLGDRNLLNVSLNWDGVMRSSFDLSFFATNVTHQKYFSFDAGLDGAGFESATLGEPFMFGGSVRYTFGS
jgi:iron complex outermembrane receptor protein